MTHSAFEISTDEPIRSTAEVVGMFARPGLSCVVADERGVSIELRVKVVGADAFVGTTRAGLLQRGGRVTGRIYDGAAVQLMVFAVEDIEATGSDTADGLLRLVEIGERSDDRGELRYDFDTPACVTIAESFTPASELRASQARVADLSTSGASFIADRRFAPGEVIDLHFEDEAGASIRARVQVLRAERAVYGRTRYATRILAIGELDQLRLDRLCNRCRLRDEAAETATRDELPLREALAAGRQDGGLRRLFGRA